MATPFKNATLNGVHKNPVHILVLCLACLFLSSCASDGRYLAEPSENQTTTLRFSTTVPPDSETSQSGMQLSSPDFIAGEAVPVNATCAGTNTFPSLQIDAIPAGTTELAFTLTNQTDPSKPLLVWLMAGVDPATSTIAAGTFPNEEAVETLNDWAVEGYGTPCIEDLGKETDTEILLQFRVYALGKPSNIQSGAPGNTSFDALKASASETASLLMKYQKQ